MQYDPHKVVNERLHSSWSVISSTFLVKIIIHLLKVIKLLSLDSRLINVKQTLAKHSDFFILLKAKIDDAVKINQKLTLKEFP